MLSFGQNRWKIVDDYRAKRKMVSHEEKYSTCKILKFVEIIPFLIILLLFICYDTIFNIAVTIKNVTWGDYLNTRHFGGQVESNIEANIE